MEWHKAYGERLSHIPNMNSEDLDITNVGCILSILKWMVLCCFCSSLNGGICSLFKEVPCPCKTSSQFWAPWEYGSKLNPACHLLASRTHWIVGFKAMIVWLCVYVSVSTRWTRPIMTLLYCCYYTVENSHNSSHHHYFFGAYSSLPCRCWWYAKDLDVTT